MNKESKHLYSIGETARMMGVSVQMLRNYSNAGILKPDVVDNDSGYRYYSFQQFHYIDRIKYLRSLDMPLSDIQTILQEGTVDAMQQLLERQRIRIEEERRRINEMYEDLVWYQDYFAYLQQHDFENIPYLVQLGKRYILQVDYAESEDVEDVETHLAALKNSGITAKMHYRRQYGYLADFEALLTGEFKPKKYFVYLKEKTEEHPNVMELPAGTYLCFRSRICAGEFDARMLARYMEKYQRQTDVVANEYEDNLTEYHHCPYEVQILLKEHNS